MTQVTLPISPWRTRLPGLLLTVAVALLALQIQRLPFPPFTIEAARPHPIDAILIAILLGMLLKNLAPLPPRLLAGARFATEKLLPLGIILLGARLDFFQVLQVSAHSLLISLFCVAVALALTYWLCQRAGVSRRLGFLIGVGTAICGGTAIVVMAPVIEAEEKDTALAVATVTLFGVAAIFVLPMLGGLLAMTQSEFGVWAGIAVQATPQVLAAGFSYGNEAGEVSTIVKLVRVLMLAPLTIGATIFYARRQRARHQNYVNKRPAWHSLIPPFIIGFLLMALANSFQLLPAFTLPLGDTIMWSGKEQWIGLQELLGRLASFFILVAMAGIGFGIDMQALRKTGLKPLYLGFAAAIILTGFSLLLIRLFL